MKKLFLILIILNLICIFSLAEIPCVCQLENCICFIQLNDGGPAVESIQHALIEQGYLLPRQDAARFDENMLQAVLRFQKDNGLTATGMLDDDTLTLLLWGMLPEELDKTEPLSNSNAIWLPTDGGIRRHIRPCCCKMDNPRRVSIRNAELLEFGPCGICNRYGEKELLNVIPPCVCSTCSVYSTY